MNGLDRTVERWIDKILTSLGCSSDLADTADRWVILLFIVLLAVAVDYTIRHIILRVVRKIIAKTRASWDDIIFKDAVMRRLCNIVTPILIYTLLPIAFSPDEGSSAELHLLIKRVVEIYMIIAVVRFINSFLNALFELLEHRPEWQGKPIKGLMQTGQVIASCIAAILIVSILINRSPAILLTGIGASAAVMMLIFKDSILGLVAGVQLSVNNMLKVGDWISMPSRGVDGVVEEVALTIVKVRGWDNTLQMLPPYVLISESFDNWQAMRDSGGRRIKRSVNFDLTSITFLKPELESRLRAGEQTAELMQTVESLTAEGKPITNLDLFVRYMTRYLELHPRVSHDLLILVRQLQPTEWGLPVEFYCFSANVNWVPYEQLQAEIISHVAALAPQFDLRLFQYPLSQDLKQ